MSSSKHFDLFHGLFIYALFQFFRLDANNPNPPPKAYDIAIDVDDVALKAKLQEAYVAITQGDQTEIQNLEEKVCTAKYSSREINLAHYRPLK
jgi:hypothetical protein